jgi:hypothetical protein
MLSSLTIQNKKSVWTLTGVELFEIASNEAIKNYLNESLLEEKLSDHRNM